MFMAVVVVSKYNKYPFGIDFAGQQHRCTSPQVNLDYGVHLSSWQVSRSRSVRLTAAFRVYARVVRYNDPSKPPIGSFASNVLRILNPSLSRRSHEDTNDSCCYQDLRCTTRVRKYSYLKFPSRGMIGELLGVHTGREFTGRTSQAKRYWFAYRCLLDPYIAAPNWA